MIHIIASPVVRQYAARLAQSALPGAPVAEVSVVQRTAPVFAVRHGVSSRLRRLVDIVEPACDRSGANVV